MERYWFGDLDGGRCSPAGSDPEALAGRIRALGPELLIPDWRVAEECGAVSDRQEYLASLRAACIALARARVAEELSAKDMELLQMVRTLDEVDHVINLLLERAVDWQAVIDPGFTRKYRRGGKALGGKIMRSRSPPLRQVGREIDALGEMRRRLARDVSRQADIVLPNTSALVGGLVAARLMAAAGGLAPLSRMPGATVQVLGARSALFSHIRGSAPSPKHGVIFQHRRVHNAPKNLRGRVARVLAAKLVIAARIDYYRGEADEAFLEKAQARIDAAGESA
ncbi:RNA-processing protein [Methanofollis formosanus]|uniref:RNA-processing protein n=1 Tax=Methanofollis formosanus TaxID=299308 RepID=A0A8G1A2E3_9EURY|nr:RNA-processing protein [Methanofollis formosanus]QYZ79119.1 RNA-processing protein [Methanofollis formosanus]